MPPVHALPQSRTQGRRDGVDVAQEGVGGAAELRAGGGEAEHGAAERGHALPQSRTQGRRDGGIPLEARIDVAQEGVGGAAELRSGGGEAEHGEADRGRGVKCSGAAALSHLSGYPSSPLSRATAGSLHQDGAVLCLPSLSRRCLAEAAVRRHAHLRDKNVMQLKKLNTALFPVRYKDKYYQDIIASKDFSKLAYYSDICVGAIACCLEKKQGGAVCVYIMTLGVLAPYRGLGLAYYSDICVGAIACCLEKKQGRGGLCLYHDSGCIGALPWSWSWDWRSA